MAAKEDYLTTDSNEIELEPISTMEPQNNLNNSANDTLMQDYFKRQAELKYEEIENLKTQNLELFDFNNFFEIDTPDICHENQTPEKINIPHPSVL